MADTDFAVTRNDVITEALEQLGALEEGESPSANQITSLARTLNMLIKHWQGQGVNMFSLRETFLFLFDDVFKYNQLDYNGTTGLDVDRKHVYVADYQAVTFAENSTTVLNVDESFLAGTPVDSAAIGDVLGIPLADGTMKWVEITAVGTAGTYSKSYTFSGHALTAATDPDITKKLIVATVYPGRPIKITNAYLRHFYNNDDRMIDVISTTDFSELSQKNGGTTGVNQVYYNRETTIGDLRTWGTIDSPYYCLGLWVQVPLSDIASDVTIGGNYGFPQELFLAFVFSLAEAVASKYGPPPDTLRSIRSLADMYRKEAFSYDTEGSVKFEPDLEA